MHHITKYGEILFLMKHIQQERVILVNENYHLPARLLIGTLYQVCQLDVNLRIIVFRQAIFPLYSRNCQTRYSFSFSLSRCLARLISKCSTGYSVHSVSSFSITSPLKRSFFPAKSLYPYQASLQLLLFHYLSLLPFMQRNKIYFRNLNRIIFFII